MFKRYSACVSLKFSRRLNPQNFESRTFLLTPDKIRKYIFLYENNQFTDFVVRVHRLFDLKFTAASSTEYNALKFTSPKVDLPSRIKCNSKQRIKWNELDWITGLATFMHSCEVTYKRTFRSKAILSEPEFVLLTSMLRRRLSRIVWRCPCHFA